MTGLSGALRAPDGAPLEIPCEQLFTSGSGQVDRGRRERRLERWLRREVVWRITDRKRLAYCGRVPRAGASRVAVRLSGGVAGYAGLQSCGSVWACPVCAARILAHRAIEIGAVLGQAVDEGYRLGFVTLTMRHDRDQDLAQLWEAASSAWARVTSGKTWAGWRSDGLVGFVRVWEVTQGRNGWHVHVHAVVVLEPGVSGEDFERLCEGMFRRWSSGLQAKGLRAPLHAGQEWHLVEGERAADELAGYLAKLAEGDDIGTALGLELTHTLPGRSRDNLRTAPVWALLDEFLSTGEVGRWREWERVSAGRRQVAWSKGLRARFAPALVELTDDDIVGDELGTAADDVLVVIDWKRLVRSPRVACAVLSAAEQGGADAASEVLRRHEVEHLVLRGAGLN